MSTAQAAVVISDKLRVPLSTEVRCARLHGVVPTGASLSVGGVSTGSDRGDGAAGCTAFHVSPSDRRSVMEGVVGPLDRNPTTPCWSGTFGRSTEDRESLNVSPAHSVISAWDRGGLPLPSVELPNQNAFAAFALTTPPNVGIVRCEFVTAFAMSLAGVLRRRTVSP